MTSAEAETLERPGDRRATPLFVNQKECAALLGLSESAWPATRAKWETRGFPKPNKDTGKYFWPAVKAWVFADNGFHATLPERPDGKENWDE